MVQLVRWVTLAQRGKWVTQVLRDHLVQQVQLALADLLEQSGHPVQEVLRVALDPRAYQGYLDLLESKVLLGQLETLARLG